MESFFKHFWDISVQLALPLFLGAGIAGLMHFLIRKDFMYRHLNGNKFSSVFKAVCLGVPLPICSCGVLPLAMSLKQKGASKGAVNGFVVSTPQTGVDSLFVAASFLGWPFAIFKLVLALFLGLVAGGLSAFVDSDESLVAMEKGQKANKASWRQQLFSWYDYSVNEILGSIWLWLLIGVSLSAILNSFLPGSGLAESLAGLNLVEQMGLMLVISLPLYVCATASIPIAASLVAAGAEPAAVLIFLIAGPATNAVAISAIGKILGWQHLLIQLIVVISGSILGGVFFSSYIRSGEVVSHHIHEVSLLSQLAAALLIVYFTVNIGTLLKSSFLAGAISNEAQLLCFRVEGMSCGACVKKIKAALELQRAWVR